MSEREAQAGDDRVRHLMMAELDGELAAAERDELTRLLAANPALEAERRRLARLKEVTRNMRLRRPPEEVWQVYWASVYRRLERGVAWILVSIGAIVLISYGAWTGVRQLLADAELPWFLKGAILAALVGGVVLFVSVLREKLFVRSREPYKDIER